MSNTVQKISAAAGCTALSLGLTLLEGNPADASLIGDEFDYVINVGEDGTSGTDIAEGDLREVRFSFEDVLQAPFSEGSSRGSIDIDESTISGSIFSEGILFEGSEGLGFVIGHRLEFNDLNWVDFPDGRIVGAQLSLFEVESGSSSGQEGISPRIVGFTDDSVFLTFNAFAEGFIPGRSDRASYNIDFEITLDVEKSVPEPSSLVSLAALGILGMGATLRRKSKSPKTAKDNFK